MPIGSRFWRWWAVERTGPAAGTPAAEIQARYLAMASAAERNDAAAQRAELDRMVQTARAAGFDEVVAAVDRLRFAAATNQEPLEIAIKALTRAIYSLPFRPSPGSKESRLLNAWALFDMAPRHEAEANVPAIFSLLVDAAEAANAHDVQIALQMWWSADEPFALSPHPTKEAFRLVALTVYKAAYHRPPPPPHDSY